MIKLITTEESIKLSEKLHLQKKQVVLAGGCFDILHKGHILFLEKAKALGDVLMILLEDDQKIQERKGNGRPVNTQVDRAKILAALPAVDYIVMLPYMKDDAAYEHLVSEIKPAIIPMTENDKYASHKEKFARQTGGKAVYVTGYIEEHSTSKLVKRI